MGRSGGRSGGSRSGGGRSGGSRSSRRSAMGSFSRSSMGSSSRSFGSSPVSRPKVGMPMHGGRYRGFGGGLFGGGNVIINVDNHKETYTNTSTGQQTATGTTAKRSGRATSGIMIFVWLVIVWVLFSVMSGVSGGSSSTGNVTKSTINREKLDLNLSDAAGYYTDECDWIRNRTTLESGLKDFYNSTGILPYVYIIDNVAGDYDPSTEKLEAFAEAKYEELFDDEGHILLLFWDYGGAYEYVLMLGYDTMEFMDTEACDILFDYLDYYYYYEDTEEEFFADAFKEAGERMMTVTRSPMYYILMMGGAVVVVVLLYRTHKSRKTKEEERKKRAEEILNSPLEKFGDDGDIIDELEKKYEKEI